MTYQAGLIGAGGIAGLGILGMHPEEEIGQRRFRASHAGGYAAADGIELVAVADIDADTLATFGEAWGIPADRRYTDHTAMLAAEDLDAVSVATPSYLHHDHVVDAAESDADPGVIWCEKPIAASVAQAREMTDVCRATDTALVVNHSFRFTEDIQQLAQLFDDGFLGTVRSVSLSFRRELMRNATHILDLLVYFLDAEPRRVSGYLNGENDAVEALQGSPVDDQGGGGHLVTADGTFVTVDCTLARDISAMTLSFIGTAGKLRIGIDDQDWRYWTLTEDGHVEASLPDIDGDWSWNEDYRDSFPNAATHVVDLLDGGATNRSPGTEATRSLAVIVALFISEYTGGHVDLPLDGPLEDVTVTSW